MYRIRPANPILEGKRDNCCSEGMSDSFESFDYGEQLVMRYRVSGLTRKEFAGQADISVSTLDYYVRRERKASLPTGFAPNRILPVDLSAPEETGPQENVPAPSASIRLRLANGRMVEVERGFDAELLLDLLVVLEAHASQERG